VADDDVASRDADLDDHAIEAPVSLVTVRQLDGDPAAHDLAEGSLEVVDLPPDQGFEAGAGK
jgi:hypothetical protein